jgi:hypothetical protein
LDSSLLYYYLAVAGVIAAEVLCTDNIMEISLVLLRDYTSHDSSLGFSDIIPMGRRDTLLGLDVYGIQVCYLIFTYTADEAVTHF